MARGLFFVFFENRYSVRFFCLFLPQDYRISAPFPALLCCCAGSFTRGTKCEELIHFPNNFFPRRSFRCLYFSTFIPIINSDNFGAEIRNEKEIEGMNCWPSREIQDGQREHKKRWYNQIPCSRKITKDRTASVGESTKITKKIPIKNSKEKTKDATS